MIRLCTTLLTCSLCFALGSESSYGMGFHGGGGGFHGGGGGGFRGGGGGGGFRGGMGGGGGGGGMRSPSVGGFGGGGGSRGGNFGGGGGGGNSGGHNFGGGNLGGGGQGGGNFGGGKFDGGNFGGHGGIPSFGGGDAGRFNGDRGGDGLGGNGRLGGDGGLGGGGQGDRVSRDQLQNFLGLNSRPGAGGGGEEKFPNRNPGGNQGNRPDWQNLSGDHLKNINDKISNQMRPGKGGGGEENQWLANHPDQAQKISSWGNQVRNDWNHNGHGNDWWHGNRPGDDWWSHNHSNLHGWYYHNGWSNHPWNYWWRGATWGALGGWLAWGGAAPVYYDYGTGGNVVYQDNSVYINGQDVGTADEYAQSAADLATVDPDDVQQSDSGSDDGKNAGDDWLPLGTFALATSKEDKNPARTIQLAVNKQGIVSGTMHNSSTNQSWVVQGKVDKQTQRVAFTIGDQKDVVLETGVYNLTQPETEVLVHYGNKTTQTDMLVRLDPPQDDSSGSSDGAPNQADPLPEVEPNQ